MRISKRLTSSWLWALCLAPVLATNVGCGGASPQAASPLIELEGAKIHPVQLAPMDFGPAVAQLLREGAPTEARLNILVATVRHQLQRANRLFANDQEQAGTDAVQGALLLVRVGELRLEMFDGALDALDSAANSAARLGDEGRARALYALLAQHLEPTSPKLSATQAHLAALDKWQEETQAGSAMTSLAAQRLARSRRALLEPSHTALEAAQKSTLAWIQGALNLQSEGSRPQSLAEQEEYIEAHRALKTGAQSLAAIHLRNSDAAGAAVAISSGSASAVSTPTLLRHLQNAADGSPEAWAQLFSFYASAATGSTPLDPVLARGAAWGAALAIYRLEPEDLRSALPLATLLVEHQMGEAAPILINAAALADQDPRTVSLGLRLSLKALSLAEKQDEIEVARRVFHHTETLFNLAGSQELQGRVQPTSADLGYFMGSLEARSGHLAEARPLLAESVRVNPTRDALRLLAGIDRQRGNLPEALKAARSMRALAKQEKNLGAEARALLLQFNLLQEEEQAKEAAGVLGDALQQALKARTQAHSSAERALAEATLAEILEQFGSLQEANAASSRAHDAAQSDGGQLAMVLQDAARRALMTGQLAAGRVTLRRAIDGNVGDEALVYIALWTQLLEKRLAVTPGGLVDEALTQIERSGTWVGALRRWGRGELNEQQLVARARTPVQEAEAEFYVAMTAHLASPSPSTKDRLRRLAQHRAIELVEVRIARAFSAPPRPRPTLPVSTKLP